MKLQYAVIALALTCLVCSFDAQAQPCRGWGPPYEGLSPAVRLSPGQLQKLTGLRQSFLKETAALEAEMAGKKLQIDSLMIETDPDFATVSKLHRELSELQVQYNEKRLSYRFRARKLLTPEQVALLPRGGVPGFGSMPYGCGPGYGCRTGRGYGRGHGRGRGFGSGPCW